MSFHHIIMSYYVSYYIILWLLKVSLIMSISCKSTPVGRFLEVLNQHYLEDFEYLQGADFITIIFDADCMKLSFSISLVQDDNCA